MTQEEEIKTIIFEGLLGDLSHQEALFIVDVALREKTDIIFQALSVEEREEIYKKCRDQPYTE